MSGEGILLNGKYELIATTIDHEDTVTDISLDRAKIENLIERMNLNELSPLHMMDIIEDFLAEDSNFFSCN